MGKPKILKQQFEDLWSKTCDEYQTIYNKSITVQNVEIVMLSENIQLDRNEIESIIVTTSATSEYVRLSQKLIEKLLKFCKLESLASIESTEEPSSNLDIPLLGRKKEMEKLTIFLNNPNLQILEVSGIPLIGKSFLIENFLGSDTFEKSFPQYNQDRRKKIPMAEIDLQTIQNDRFENRYVSGLVGTNEYLLILQNFEALLDWKCNSENQHGIKKEYINLKEYINKWIKNPKVKIIIESRFKIDFDQILNSESKVDRLKLEGIHPSHFRPYYSKSGITKNEFEIITSNLDNHTGLLALAYNRVNLYLDGDLSELVRDDSSNVSLKLWNILQKIIEALEEQEKIILCALTISRRPTSIQDLLDTLINIEEYSQHKIQRNHIFSLSLKLLIERKGSKISLNPYMKQVAYSNLRYHSKSDIDILRKQPLFRDNLATHSYDKFTTLLMNEDAQGILEYAKESRKGGNSELAIEMLLRGLHISNIYNKAFYLLEIATNYRYLKKFDSALEYVEKGLSIKETKYLLQEKAICLRETGKIKEALLQFNELAYKLKHLPALQELAKMNEKADEIQQTISKYKKLAFEHGHIPAFTSLAKIYKESNNLTKAIETLEKSLEFAPNDKKTLNTLALYYKEDGDLENSRLKFEKLVFRLRHQPAFLPLAKIYFYDLEDLANAQKVIDSYDTSWGHNQQLIMLQSKIKGSI